MLYTHTHPIMIHINLLSVFNSFGSYEQGKVFLIFFLVFFHFFLNMGMV